MNFLEYLLVLTGVICCTAVPVSDPNAPPGSCGVPDRYPDKELQGIWNDKFYSPGKRAQYSCRPGFSRLGLIQYLCSEGEWVPMGNLGQCKKKSCGHPGDIEFGTFELKNEEEFVFGAVVAYTCNDGYQMISRHRTRECTATGWTNFRPECEVRFCPPVQVDSNVNLLTTSYDEEYSVGQVIRFECKNANQKLNGASEIFCTSEGDWNAQPPICEEISCGKPKIDHGSVTGPKLLYKDRETTEYSCYPGYKPSTPTGLTCTRNDWSPMPLCEEIVCYQETVKYGNVKYIKETYRDGDTVELKCIEGYQIEHNPEELRKCTSRGWSPPLKCISKKCDKPIVLNGYIDSWASFPVSAGRSVYSVCNSGFSTSTKENYETITCTKNGWDREPKCFKKCNAPSQSSINAHITYTTSPYIEGDKLRFQCYRDYTTLDRQQIGEITCLPDGKFSGEKCHKTCQTPKLPHGEYKTRESTFEVGEYVLYECSEGYISSNKAYEGRSQCGSDGWYPKPECKEIRCPLHLARGEESFKFGKVIYYQCPSNSKLEGASSSQCFYYGWGPTFPICKGPRHQEFPLLVDIKTEPKESDCPTASAPPNARIKNLKDEYFSEDVMEIECNPGYLLYGSERVLCKDGRWQSPPLCTEKIPCSSSPPEISNGEISKETLAARYHTGSTVKYTCADGYHIIGSDEIKCIDGKWLLPPTCVENSCEKPQEIENGKPRDGRKEYKHAESAAYECFPGYKLSGSEAAVCLYGKWDRIPKCIYSSCGPPRKISNGEIRGQEKTTYLTGEKVIYDCIRGYTVGNNANVITCDNAAWTEPPECRRIGQTCGAPPVVQNGDVTDLRTLSYSSGSIVKYKCANFYKLEGKETITCRDGEWEKEPICRVPCTVREIDMQQNNIRFKHINDNKLYSVHFDNMTFVCIPGYKISDEKRLRIQCLDGVLKYPKCLKEGFCVLQQTEMSQNNIRYNKSNEIENGQTIEFECVEGLVPENGLKQTCMNKRITYPKCSTGRPCLPPKISHASISPTKEESYESGSSIDIKCVDTYVLNGHISVKCNLGKWDELPQCFKPCTISTRDLDKNHIEMKPSENLPELLEHGTEVNVKCKANFKRPGSLTALCYDGIMKYPKCFSGDFCRINQQNLDDNFLELDEKHENEVFYEAGEIVSFKCKTGYSNRTGLTGTCTKPEKEANYGLTYPVCT